MARTFVGTPSYLAPEVEEKQGGRGKPYGTPVDCWSLGAMLYVMLVARFPEFQVQVGYIVGGDSGFRCGALETNVDSVPMERLLSSKVVLCSFCDVGSCMGGVPLVCHVARDAGGRFSGPPEGRWDGPESVFFRASMVGESG